MTTFGALHKQILRRCGHCSCAILYNLIVQILSSGYGLVAMTFASHAKGREFDPHYPYVSFGTYLFVKQISTCKSPNAKSAGALPAGSWISVIMFPRHRRLTHTTTSLIHLTLCLLSAFHYCHHQSDHSSSKAERQWCSQFFPEVLSAHMFDLNTVFNWRPYLHWDIKNKHNRNTECPLLLNCMTCTPNI